MKKKTPKKRKSICKLLDIELLTSLLRGEIVILCGNGGQPSIELELEAGERPHDMEDALELIRNSWEL